MVVYRSAYQQFFQGPQWDEYSRQEYTSKVQYRNDRRSVEHQHHVWFWDSDVEDEDIEEVVAPKDGGNNVADHKSAAAGEKSRQGDEKKPRQAWADVPKRRLDDKTLEQKSERHKNDRESCGGKEATRIPHKTRDGHEQSSEKRERRVRSAHSSKVAKDKQKAAPFVAYGWANDGKVDKKRTHNVLASAPEVYPAALRAAKRRELDIKKKVQKHEEAIKKKEIRALAENIHEDHAGAMWTTEYQRNFCKDEDIIHRHFPRQKKINF